MLSSVRLLSHGRGVRQHPQPQKIGQAHLCHICPFLDIPRLSLFSARCRKGRYSGNVQLPLPRNARTGSFWPAPWLASLCSNGTHIAKYIASCFPKTTLSSRWAKFVAIQARRPPTKNPKSPQSTHKALIKPTNLTYASPTLLCPIALLLPHARQGDGGLIDILATWPVSRNRLSWLFTRCCLWARSTKR